MTITKVEKVLVAKRTTDGRYLRLDKHQHTTSFEFVDDPEIAERVRPYIEDHFKNPKPAPYYFENSSRAREYWLKDCVMVPFEITTEVSAKKL